MDVWQSPPERGLPIFDLAQYTQGTDRDRQQITQTIYHACHTMGFLYVRNYGIPPALEAAAFAASRDFFQLPLAAKQAVAWHAVSNRGYVGVARERLDESQPGDLKEAFNLGRERSPADLVADPQNPAVQFNQWPVELPNLPTTLMQFYEACTQTAHRLLEVFAIALNLPADYLVARHQLPWFTLRLLHYPPIATPPRPGQVRAGTHSDYGTLTLLFQDAVEGLEVQRVDGEWIAAPALPGHIIINTGDLMERWSNGVFCSTKHRVTLPAAENNCDRYSLAFFCEPDPEVEIACLETCCTPDSPPRYPPITTAAYLYQRLQATY